MQRAGGRVFSEAKFGTQCGAESPGAGGIVGDIQDALRHLRWGMTILEW